MFYEGNWVPMRRGIVKHLTEGVLTPTEYMVLMTVILLADKARGIWRGSSPALVAISGQQFSASYIKVAMAGLVEKGYIATDHVPGSRGNFNVLINRYQVTVGKQKNKRVSLDLSNVGPGVMDPQYEGAFAEDDESDSAPEVAPEPPLESVPDDAREIGPEGTPEVAPYSIPSKPFKSSQNNKSSILTNKAARSAAEKVNWTNED